MEIQTINKIDTRNKEPKDVALELANQSAAPQEDLALASTGYNVSLTNDGGYFMLQWSVSGPIGSYDWVGLFVNQFVPDSDYIGSNWQWAQYGSSYKTSTAVQAGYQARYLVWDAKTAKYVSVARTAVSS